MKGYFFVLLAVLGTGCSSIDRDGHTEDASLSAQAQDGGVKLEGVWECRDFLYDDEVALEIGKTNVTVGDVVAEKINEFLRDDDASIEELKKEKEFTESLDKLKEYYAGFIRLIGEKGEAAFYYREGLNHRWEWGDGYGFVIEPSGRGHYYDFTDSAEGESVKPSDTFKCKRK